MTTLNKNEVYSAFLEAINESLDTETLYQDTFQIILKAFNTNRVQLWEKISNLDEMSIFYEYYEGNEIPMIKFRVPVLPNDIKKSIDKTNIWEYANITNINFTRYNINSLLGIEFQFPTQNMGLLVLTSEEKNKKYDQEEIIFLIKLKKQLEHGAFKTEKYTKNTDEAKRLQIQNNQLREQDRLRTNFINNICHELKTPLASILGFSKILSTKNPKEETAKEIADQIGQAANRLSTLINDFLQINKIDTEGWLAHIEPCDIGELIKKTIEEFSLLNKKHKFSYFVSDNYPIIKTDTKLIRQVLDNLISNAVKYSPNGGNVTVSFQVLSTTKQIKVSVADSGIGIDKEEILKIFDRFYRSNDPEARKVSGSGLGLAICKEIITKLNGQIEVESELQKGSKFSFTLPIN